MRAAARRLIYARRSAADYYTKPSKKVPAVIIGIDDADAVLTDTQGARLIKEILSSGSKLGVGLLLVVSDISALESDATLMRYLLWCENVVTTMPDGEFILADLRARHCEPRPRTWREDCVSFVLHRGPQDTTLGLVVAATGPEATPADAQSWCGEQLAARGIKLMDWKLVGDDPRSWWTMDPIAARRWSLRRHHDAWALIQLITNAPAITVPQGSDTLRWAGEAIDNRFTVDLTPWRAGPTTGEEGFTTLYADVTGDIVSKNRSESILKMLLYPY